MQVQQQAVGGGLSYVEPGVTSTVANGVRIRTPDGRAGSSACRNTPDHEGGVDGEARAQAQTRSGVGVLVAVGRRCGHGRGVQTAGDRSQGQLSVAVGERRAAAGAAVGAGPVEQVPVPAGAAADHHAAPGRG